MRMSSVSEPAQAETRLGNPDVDPIVLFQTWFDEALRCGLKEPRAMSVATVDETGTPDVRILLLKGVDERGFVFYTNLGSPKAKALLHDSRVALCFYWAQLDKQVRIRGHAELVPNNEADAYFATRPRLSQISAWASKQSKPMLGYYELEAEVAKKAIWFGMGPVPRPSFWSGFRVRPDRMEFWQQRPYRRHQRVAYELINQRWQSHWLFP